MSLVPDTRRLSPARAAISEGKSWELRSPGIRSPRGVPRRKPRDWDEDRTSASRPSLRLPADRPPRSRSFHHALAGLLGSGVFPARRCADPGSPRGARHRRRLRVGTGLLGSGARRGRGQGRCGPRRAGLRILSVQSWTVGLALLGVQRTCSGECVHNYLFNLWIQSERLVHASLEQSFSFFFREKLFLERKAT